MAIYRRHASADPRFAGEREITRVRAHGASPFALSIRDRCPRHRLTPRRAEEREREREGGGGNTAREIRAVTAPAEFDGYGAP